MPEVRLLEPFSMVAGRPLTHEAGRLESICF